MPREDMLPGILAEWDFEKNRGVCPESVSVIQKVSWKCRGDRPNCTENCDHPHEWMTSISYRFASDGTRKTGCPYCSGNQTICPCQSLSKRRPDLAQQFHPTKNGSLTPQDVACQSNKKVMWRCTLKLNCTESCDEIHEYPATVDHRMNGSGCPWCSSRRGKVCPCQSLKSRYPYLAGQWHPTENGSLTPKDVSTQSNKRVMWLCTSKSNCTESCSHIHQWPARVYDRVNGNGCPWCSSKGGKVCPCQSLKSRYPYLSGEWHPTENGSLTPKDVSTQSGRKVVWLCSSKLNCTESCNQIHQWLAPVSDRVRGTGCPWCSTGGKVLCPCQSLISRCPYLAGEWHPTKNGSLTPKDVSVSSGKNAWWLCRDCGHVYDATINNRNNGTGCPKCCINKAEKRLEEMLSSHTLVSRYSKPGISCYDHIRKKQRTLRPDCIGTTVNGNKFMIELDGPQHFENVYWYDSNGSDLEDQICRDLAKNRYAADNGMSLLRVSYREYGDLEMWVNAFLEKCSKTTEQVMIPSNPALYNNQRNIAL
jgi:hypothetical protein